MEPDMRIYGTWKLLRWPGMPPREPDWKGRPHFHYVTGERAPANSGAPIALIAYGQDNAEALRRADLGKVVPA